MLSNIALLGQCQGKVGNGIGMVHRIPPVELKCVGEKKSGEIALLVGRKASQIALVAPSHGLSTSIFQPPP
jgi:hypothetical protein